MSLLSASIRDVVFSRRARKTRLDVPLRATSIDVESVDTMSANNKAVNGANGTATTSRFDPHFTDGVLNAVGSKANPRMKKVMGSLVKHLHDFCRENEITVDEYMAGIKLVSSTGRCVVGYSDS